MSSADTPRPLQIGVLGAARISTAAIIDPAHELGAHLVAVAARDRSRAEAYAAEHGFTRVHDDYQAVIDNPDVEVVYNPLTNAQHAPWNLRAVAAGKPVLTEKPFASNAAEARTVRDTATAAGVHVIDAFHQAYHPMMARLIELAGSGEIGDLQYVEARMLMPSPDPDDLRWSADLAGGALMDVGCYAVHSVRDLAPLCGGEPRVVAARGGEHPDHPGVDAWMSADLELPNGVPARVEASMTHHRTDSSLRLVGSRGEAYAPSFIKAQLDDRVLVTLGGETRVEHLGTRSTYIYMVEALTRLVRDGVPMRTDADDAVATMQAIDDIYRAAGMDPRGTTPKETA